MMCVVSCAVMHNEHVVITTDNLVDDMITRYDYVTISVVY